MGQFSDDGQWWWDGTAWLATAQVVLPKLPMTEFEQSGKLKTARDRMRKADWLHLANSFRPLAWLTGGPLISVAWPAMRDYRTWTLEQLALATAYLLGPDEPMLAGEGTILDDTFDPDLAVVVTPAHVLVFRIESRAEQPRWIVLAGRPIDVKMEVRTGPFGLGPTLVVTGWNGQWTIRGQPGVFKPQPVLDAWRQAGDGQ